MGKLRQTALILGEGPTEFFYFKSLCDVFKRLTIKPDYPKHTNINDADRSLPSDSRNADIRHSQREWMYKISLALFSYLLLFFYVVILANQRFLTL